MTQGPAAYQGPRTKAGTDPSTVATVTVATMTVAAGSTVAVGA